MSRIENRDQKLRRMRARRRRIVRVQKIVLSLSLTAVVFLSVGIRQTLKDNESLSASQIHLTNTQTATAAASILGNANTVLQEAVSAAVETNKTRYIAHRGYSSNAPENSIPAFELAARNGAWGIETDVRYTKDGKLVCMHDDSLDRMTTGSGKIDTMDYNQIASAVIDAGPNVEKYSGLAVPTLEQFLDICQSNGITAVLDIKFANNDMLAKVVEIVISRGMEKSCVILSDPKGMALIRTLSSDIQIQFLQETASSDMLNQAAAFTNSGVCISNITPDLITQAHSLGLRINVWTYDLTEQKASWTSQNVNYITTDNLGT